MANFNITYGTSIDDTFSSAGEVRPGLSFTGQAPKFKKLASFSSINNDFTR